MHGHAPWLLAGSLHSSPAGAFAGTPRNVLCPLQSVAPCTPLRWLVVDLGLPPLSELDLSAQMHGFPNTPLWVCRRGASASPQNHSLAQHTHTYRLCRASSSKILLTNY